MRMRWKLLGGAGLAGIGLAFLIVGHSRISRGDTPASDPVSDAPDPNRFDPDHPYTLGLHAIPYEQLGAVDKDGVDSILETEALSQRDSSYAVWADAAATAAADAQAQIAARSVGLVGTATDGVDP